MSGDLSPRQRIQAALNGDDVDRVPIGLWRHFPEEDQTPDGLVEATVRYQEQFQSDLVKLMPTGMYSVVGYGVEIEVAPGNGGSTQFLSGPIAEASDWTRLPEVSPDRGVLRDQVEVTGRVREAFGPDVPVIQTIFSPLTMANKASGDLDLLQRHLKESPDQIRVALAQFSEDVISFGRACIDAGVDGFFFATQLGNRSTLDDDLYAEFGEPYDMHILETLRPGTWFTMLHLHGAEPLFELAGRYPVDAVNWHDRETPPALGEARAKTNRCPAGGINRAGVICRGTPYDVRAEVREAVEQTDGKRTIIAPGCVIPFDAPEQNLHAVREAVAN